MLALGGASGLALCDGEVVSHCWIISLGSTFVLERERLSSGWIVAGLSIEVADVAAPKWVAMATATPAKRSGACWLSVRVF